MNYELPYTVELIVVTPEMRVLDDTHRWVSCAVGGFCRDCGVDSDDVPSTLCPHASEAVKAEALRKLAELRGDERPKENG